MKKFVFILVAVMLTTACQQKKDAPVVKVQTFQDKAVAYRSTAIDECFPHDWQNQPSVSEVEVLINDDSTYVEQFKMRYQNEFGGISDGKITYVYINDNGMLRHAVFDYSQNNNYKFIMAMAEVYNHNKDKYPQTWDLESGELASSAARLMCTVYELNHE